MFETIMVCLDGSKLSEQVLPYASEIAARFGSKIVLFRGITYLPGITVETETEGTATAIEASRHEEEEAREDLAQKAAQLGKRGLEVEVSTVRGIPEEVIVEFVETMSIDLIAMTTHGRTGVGRAFYGSVADHVVRNAARPVLIIRPVSA